MISRRLALTACGFAGLVVCAATAWAVAGRVEDRVVTLAPTARYPHDPRAFTQGFDWEDGVLYEGTGRHGTSVLRTVDLETGATGRFRKLPERYFGEGVCVLGDEVYQLTWQAGVCFVFDRETFAPARTFRYAGEGWGLTTDGARLILSDGTPVLRFLDPATGRVLGRVRVTDAGRPVRRLNELEWVPGPDPADPAAGAELLANVWYDRRIARIDPAMGAVTGWLDASALVRAAGVTDREHALNGVAHDPAGKRLLLTGKYWPAVFEVPWPPDS